MHVLRREPRSERFPSGPDLSPTETLVDTDAERCEEYADARELATTGAEHGDIDRGGWCRTRWAD